MIRDVLERIWRSGVPIYRFKDYDNEVITGTFYQFELQKINISEDQMWKLEKILKPKRMGQNRQYCVKWLHWPTNFNSWVKSSDIQNI
jgi:hypothetical protein